MSDERVKRNVEDVDYATLDGPRPMREVLHDRARLHNAQPKDQREAAFRERAGMIGMLQSCLCLFPLARASTASGHEEWCPADALHRSAAEVKRLYPDGVR